MRISTNYNLLRRWLVAGSLLSLLGLTACNSDTTSGQDPQVAEPAVPHPADFLADSLLPTQKQIETILKEMGHTQYEFKGNSIVVDGDIVFHRSDFMRDSSETRALGKIAQNTRVPISDRSKVSRDKYLRVKISPRLNDNWRKATEEAVRFWNGFAHIPFIIANGFEPEKIDVWVITGTSGHPYGTARTPSFIFADDGYHVRRVLPGNLIEVNMDRFPKLDPDLAKSVMIHLFSHAVGFDHTDSKNIYVSHIPGTPEKDKESLFNTNPTFKYRGWITEGDWKAIKFYYPDPKKLQNRSGGAKP